MNPANQDMYYQPHLAGGPPPPPQQQPQSQSHYGHQQPHQQQPPLLHPGPSQYPPPQYSHGYGYHNGLASPPGPPQGVAGPMGPGSNVLPLPNVPQQAMQANQFNPNGFDTTGQVAPPGMKPRVTATLWEDEGSLCFQVEARGICVARREDNHMINGTKLLNVAGMTRGRRDGILKSEKMRHVVKIGPMHLKGVWIPYERALDFANKEKITELLYPLFVHNIGALLYHPTNQSRTNQVMQVQKQRQDSSLLRPGQPALPSLQQHHHHSIPLPPPQLPSHQHQSMGRPSMERSHFPTPPTSASSILGNVGSTDNFQWSQHGMSNNGLASNGQPQNPMTIDTGLSNGNIADSHSNRGPNTPATTPPGSGVQSMHSYPPVSQGYENSRQMYQGAQPQHSPYQPSNAPPHERPMYAQQSPPDRQLYAQQSPYVKSEMGPPSSRPGGAVSEQVEPKSQAPEDEGDHEEDTAEYTHDGGAYDANSGRATPRSAAPQTYYSQGGYHAPLPPVMNGGSGSLKRGREDDEVYANQSELNGSLPNGYAPPPVMNGGSSGLKRGRDDEDERPTSGDNGMPMDSKRRKMTLESSNGTAPPPPYGAHALAMPQPSPVAPQRRR